MPELVILHAVSEHVGWSPIRHLIALAAEQLGASVARVADRNSRLTRQIARLRTRKKNTGKPHVLYIAMTPADVSLAVTRPGWRDDFDQAAVWIIDSFHTEQINPRDLQGHFDHVFVTRENDVPAFSSSSGVPTSVLPWGSDVLGFGSAQPDRDIDLLRVGRQPAIWEDDRQSIADCNARAIRFQGRPPKASGPDQMANLFSWYTRAKFVLASSNLASPAPYVHKTQEYMTARWTDSLAAGAIVAGVPPRTDKSFQSLCWPEATLYIPLTSREEGLDTLSDALRRWSPETVRLNHARALTRLDWRHRLAQIAELFSLDAPKLQYSLDQISERQNG